MVNRTNLPEPVAPRAGAHPSAQVRGWLPFTEAAARRNSRLNRRMSSSRSVTQRRNVLAPSQQAFVEFGEFAVRANSRSASGHCEGAEGIDPCHLGCQKKEGLRAPTDRRTGFGFQTSRALPIDAGLQNSTTYGLARKCGPRYTTIANF